MKEGGCVLRLCIMYIGLGIRTTREGDGLLEFEYYAYILLLGIEMNCFITYEMCDIVTLRP